MTRNKRQSKEPQPSLNSEEREFIEAFEAEHARLLETEGLEAAKTYFQENFMVRCFGCGYLGNTVPPLNCARCDLYLD